MKGNNVSMASNSLGSEDETDDCIFCLIATDQDKETEVIKKTEELVCFRDIYPAAPHHYLVVPIQHIESCLSLHRRHVGLVERMVQVGKAVLQDQGITDMEDVRLGFHQPPFTSVGHLHLHVLAPGSQISKYLLFKFIPNTDRFVTEDSLLKRLKYKAPPAPHSQLSLNSTYAIGDVIMICMLLAFGYLLLSSI